MFGTRPRAARRSDPSTTCSPDGVWSRTRTDCPDSPSTWSHRRPERARQYRPRERSESTCSRDIGILARKERLGPLDDRDPAAEPAEHLGELAADVAAAEDDEVFRQSVELLDRLAVQRPRLDEPGQRRQGRPGAGVDEHLVGGHFPHPAVPEPDFQGARPGEAGRTDQQRHPGAVEVGLVAPDHLGDHGPLPIADPDRVSPVERHADAERGRPPGQFGHLGGLDHRLGRDAGDVDASAADHPLLDHDDPATGGRHLRRQRLAALAPADDGKLEMLSRHGSPLSYDRPALRTEVRPPRPLVCRHPTHMVSSQCGPGTLLVPASARRNRHLPELHARTKWREAATLLCVNAMHHRCTRYHAG